MGRDLPDRRILADATTPLGHHLLLADYCCFKISLGVTDARGQFATALVVVDKDTGAAAAMSLLSKEATPFATEFVVRFIDRCGLTKVTLRTDGEPAMTSLADTVKDKREHGTILQQQQAPKHSSASKGAAERAHWEAQSQTRTMESQIAGACQTVAINHTHPIFPWTVRHSGWLMTRFLVKATGMTAYCAVYGVEYRRETVPFGETIMIKIPVPDH